MKYNFMKMLIFIFFCATYKYQLLFNALTSRSEAMSCDPAFENRTRKFMLFYVTLL